MRLQPPRRGLESVLLPHLSTLVAEEGVLPVLCSGYSLGLSQWGPSWSLQGSQT